MRSTLPAIAMSVAVALLAVACGSTASPAPVTTPPPSAAPARTAAPSTPPQPLSPTPDGVHRANTAIAAGYTHTCALTSGGGVRCWGSNGNGQLGNGTTSDVAVPGAVEVTGLASGVAAVAAGGSHTCVLTTGGGVKCWGYNMYGQLGNGSNVDSSVPVDVVGLESGVAAISVGWSSTCAVTRGGGVKCWGNNPFGGLGDGTKNDSSVPVDVVGLRSGMTAVATGVLHTCGLTGGGRVICWGYGQSDDPAVFQTSVPVDVPGLASGVTAIGAGLDRTCALANDGQVRCWGPNYAAPPEGGPMPDRFVSVDVSRLAGDVSAIAVGETHACALITGGGAACWGSDAYSQLGRGSTSDGSVAVPVEVSGLGSGVTGIAVGGMHTCALATGGVKCWGANGYGQLGSVMPCSSSSVPVDASLDGHAAEPPVTSEFPPGRIEHATGSTDVVLRYDVDPDVGVSELGGEQFNPGPEFTLYGDGAVIFRDMDAERPPAEGPIVRARAFMIARLDDDQVQALLRFALGEGGLASACDRYETQDTDNAESHILTIRAGGLVKRVDLGGPNPMGPLIGRLRSYDPGSGTPTQVWAPDRYWGSLLDAAGGFESGVLPKPRDTDVVAWPWPAVAAEDFAGRDEGGWIGSPRRVMSAAEAAVLGLSDNGGVVQRIYLRGPDRKTIYYFSLWPMSPDEPS